MSRGEPAQKTSRPVVVSPTASGARHAPTATRSRTFASRAPSTVVPRTPHTARTSASTETSCCATSPIPSSTGAHTAGTCEHAATSGLRAPSWFARISRAQPRTSHGHVAAGAAAVITPAACSAARTSG